ncbi:MAG TPA: hypothetical protein VFL55_17670 [Acetobacteraceae bacterium]|nr:hypothetical protein [Acetobacteraceae bacterium]
MLPLIRVRGKLHRSRVGERFIITTRWAQSPLVFDLWSPFANWQVHRRPAAGYARAVGRQSAKEAALGYGLDVWRSGSKVLSFEWNADGWTGLVSMKPGSWEDEALVLA